MQKPQRPPPRDLTGKKTSPENLTTDSRKQNIKIVLPTLTCLSACFRKKFYLIITVNAVYEEMLLYVTHEKKKERKKNRGLCSVLQLRVFQWVLVDLLLYFFNVNVYD